MRCKYWLIKNKNITNCNTEKNDFTSRLKALLKSQLYRRKLVLVIFVRKNALDISVIYKLALIFISV